MRELRELMVRRRSSRKKKSSGVAFRLFLFLLFVWMICGAAAAWFVFLPSGSRNETFVEITPGSSSNLIATQLEQAGVIRSRYGFDLVRLWKRGRLKAGEYRFDHAAPVTEVYARIARGDVYTLPVTIPEGSTRFDIAARIVQAGFLNSRKEDFLAATVSETPLISDLDPKARSLEGYLFPDTYRFPRKATPAQIINSMVRRFRTVASELDLTQPGASPNLHNLVTLASLVERETAVSSERPLVASVLSNRLAKKMPLMTDPSVIYGLQIEGQWRGTIYQSDLTRDTPYNTYRHAGLPPGPIANPGMASLRAAMNPAATDYLYFVAAGADPQGKSRFAATLDEHNKNVASYRKAVKQAGGR
jgi:peptidoglycan lytic transglycosylase G